jgi:hypothetical protein
MSAKQDEYIKMGVVYEDSEGIYFRIENKKGETLGKKRPSELGYSKEMSSTVYVYKEIQSEENLTDSTVYFEMELKFSFPEEKRFKYAYFYKAKSGKVFVRDFDSAICSEVGINDNTFVTRGKTHKLPENSRIPLDAPIFRLNAQTSELERQVTINPLFER